MIEVEIRGQLNKQEAASLKEFLAKNGTFLGHEDREMFLLRDYDGYSYDPTIREVDIRLRNTDGNCEIMMKKKASKGNVGRKEISIQLKDTNLENAKQIVKAFGCKKALKMQRSKDIYEYQGIEWSVVETPKEYFYFEAEKEAPTNQDIPGIHNNLTLAAQNLHLKVLNEQETKEFIEFLDKEVNQEVEL